eukprot:PhF_6_TR13427/c0_g1_i4/m.21421
MGNHPSCTTTYAADLSRTGPIMQSYVDVLNCVWSNYTIACDQVFHNDVALMTNQIFSSRDPMAVNTAKGQFRSTVYKSVEVILDELAIDQSLPHNVSVLKNATKHPSIQQTYLENDIMYILWAPNDDAKFLASLERKGTRAVAQCALPMLCVPVVTTAVYYGYYVTAIACCPIGVDTLVNPGSGVSGEYWGALSSALLGDDHKDVMKGVWRLHLGRDGHYYSLGNAAFLYTQWLNFNSSPSTPKMPSWTKVHVSRPEAQLYLNDPKSALEFCRIALQSHPSITTDEMRTILKLHGITLKMLGTVFNLKYATSGWAHGAHVVFSEMVARAFRSCLHAAWHELHRLNRSVIQHHKIITTTESWLKGLLQFRVSEVEKWNLGNTLIPELVHGYGFDPVSYPGVSDEARFIIFRRCCELCGLETQGGRVKKISPIVAEPMFSQRYMKRGLKIPEDHARILSKHESDVLWRKLIMGIVPEKEKSSPVAMLERLLRLELDDHGQSHDTQETVFKELQRVVDGCDKSSNDAIAFLLCAVLNASRYVTEDYKLTHLLQNCVALLPGGAASPSLLVLKSNVEFEHGKRINALTSQHPETSPQKTAFNKSQAMPVSAEASAQFEASVATLTQAFGNSSFPCALRCVEIGDLLLKTAHTQSATPFLQSAVEILTTKHNASSVTQKVVYEHELTHAQHLLAVSLCESPTPEGSTRGLEIQTEVVESLRHTLPVDVIRLVDALNSLGTLQYHQGSVKLALTTYNEALQLAKSHRPKPKEQILLLKMNIAVAVNVRQFKAAVIIQTKFRKSLARARQRTVSLEKRQARDSMKGSETVKRNAALTTFFLEQTSLFEAFCLTMHKEFERADLDLTLSKMLILSESWKRSLLRKHERRARIVILWMRKGILTYHSKMAENRKIEQQEQSNRAEYEAEEMDCRQAITLNHLKAKEGNTIEVQEQSTRFEYEADETKERKVITLHQAHETEARKIQQHEQSKRSECEVEESDGRKSIKLHHTNETEARKIEQEEQSKRLEYGGSECHLRKEIEAASIQEKQDIEKLKAAVQQNPDDIEEEIRAPEPPSKGKSALSTNENTDEEHVESTSKPPDAIAENQTEPDVALAPPADKAAVVASTPEKEKPAEKPAETQKAVAPPADKGAVVASTP